MADDIQIRVRKAARALAGAGLVHAYGHCSQRIDDKKFLVCAPKPMGLIAAGEDGHVVPIDGDLPDGVLGEVRIHQHIYRRRADVGGIARTMPPNAMSLSTLGLTPKARHGFGAYFYPSPPLWDDPLLVRNDEAAAGVAEALGDARAVVMRGNGVVSAGDDIEQAVVFAWYLEDAAKAEWQVLQASAAIDAGRAEEKLFNAEEAEIRAVGLGRIYERMWEFLTHGDPE
ncbi:MAG: class II aldolase/adducin family protein [Rhodospirillaceae bacterium]|mgnify:FL=1|jgi:HCOMODA/2-hydroxy-3-carboxy-muconic semialdehyde decarboxylase|nr:class II aldolase/adducin family protein [Rhodospirillaceae bacterium]MBT3887623.1 class II aldolase/adducin family protein [Rhodospirillaceae bacterium]MBT4117138.1 class II aldolase/adducin family protein [Rhodospirillaceae bacterium]MBT4672833.1 class II aldolase/adducin family protein [Rhodospirillaceae bacterium]MBT4751402.1 class II aldolase/adducin family protein [Rhodospirillaceae bacterium]